MDTEGISKVLDDLKNRFASRFIFSFTIAWLLYNWQISIALFWYDKSQFEAEGCKSIFEFISDQLKNNSNSEKAVFAALAYTLVLPISKSLINIWDEVILDLRNWSKTKLVRSQDAKTIKELKDKLYKIKDYSLIDGNWLVRRESKVYDDIGTVLKTEPEQFEVYIYDRQYYIVEKDSKKIKYYFNDFFYNPIDDVLIFILESRDIPKGILITKLRLENGRWDRLSGTENDTEIEYKKYK